MVQIIRDAGVNRLEITGGGGGAFGGVAAGSQTATSGTVAFVNSNGMTFGMSNSSQITASYTVPTQTNQTLGVYAVSNTTGASSSSTVDARSLTFQGAGVASVGMTNGSVVISVPSGGGAGDGGNVLAAGTQTANTTGTVLFNNANGITFGMNNSSVITASHNGLTSQSNQAVSAANGSSTFQTLSFADGNGVSFSTAAGGVVATVRTDYLSTQSNQALSGSNGSFAFQTATFGALNGLSFYTSNGSMVGSYTVPTVTNSSMTVSDSATSGTLARLAFTNLNGVTLSLSTGAGGSHTIVGSHNALTSQSNQAFSAGGGSSAFQTLGFSDNAYASWTNTNGSIALTELRGSLFAVSNTTQSSSGTQNLDAVSFNGAGIVSVGVTNGSVVVSATQSNQAFSAPNASSTFQTLSFNNANGATFSNNAGAIELSYTRPVVSNAIQAVGSASNSGTNTSRFAADDHVHPGVFSMGVSNVGNTSGDTRVDVGRFVLAGGNNVTLSQATAANALNTITISAAAQTNQTVGGYAVGNTTGASSSSTLDARSFSIQGAGAASVGFTNGSWVISAPNAGAGNVTFSAGTTSNGLANVVFSNSNGVSFGLNGSTITASVNAGGGAGFSAGMSNLGDTNGTSGTVGSQLVFVGTNGMELSQSVNGGSATLSIQQAPFTRLIWPYHDLTAISAPVNGSISVQYMPMLAPLSATRLDIMASMSPISSADARSFFLQVTGVYGLYTRNDSTLNSVSTGSTTFTTGSWQSTNSTISYASANLVSFPFTVNATPGEYYMLFALSTNCVSTSTSSQTVAAMSMTMFGGGRIASNVNFKDLGASSATSRNVYSNIGIYSATTNAALPAAISLSGINATGTNIPRANIGFQMRG